MGVGLFPTACGVCSSTQRTLQYGYRKRRYPDVPIIIATAVAAETGIAFGIDTSSDKQWIKADLYLEKGIRKDQLHNEINKLLKL